MRRKRNPVPGEEKIPTNLRLLRILELMGEADAPMTPTAIGEALGMAKPTAHRLCNTLVDERFLVSDGHSKGLRPGRRSRSMASGILFSSSLHVARHQILMALARDVGETVNFVVPEDRGMTYQDRVETDWAFQVKLPVGSHVPFHCTASGKTYLASLPTKTREAMVHSLTLEPYTKTTHTDPASLLADLKTIRRQGYALDNEEFMEGMMAIAVPVRDPQGRYVASLAFHGPYPRVTLDVALSKRDIMFKTAERLTNAMLGG